mmetsp:Transcript_22837/g.44556  ORF Transcript_22837/g.44556 Transcript_22837/m.44556 type:complete len:308 (+) Transcript_22837:350-1273(+)
MLYAGFHQFPFLHLARNQLDLVFIVSNCCVWSTYRNGIQNPVLPFLCRFPFAITTSSSSSMRFSFRMFVVVVVIVILRSLGWFFRFARQTQQLLTRNCLLLLNILVLVLACILVFFRPLVLVGVLLLILLLTVVFASTESTIVVVLTRVRHPLLWFLQSEKTSRKLKILFILHRIPFLLFLDLVSFASGEMNLGRTFAGAFLLLTLPLTTFAQTCIVIIIVVVIIVLILLSSLSLLGFVGFVFAVQVCFLQPLSLVFCQTTLAADTSLCLPILISITTITTISISTITLVLILGSRAGGFVVERQEL